MINLYVLFNLQRRHIDKYNEYKTNANSTQPAKKRRISCTSSNSSETENILDAFQRPKKVSPEKLLSIIVMYIINSMSPLCTVDQPYFVQLLTGECQVHI